MPKNEKTSNLSKKPLREIRVLRNKDPKGTNTSKSKDGIGFNRGKASGGRPKADKKNLICRQMGKATVCFDKSKPKRADGKKVKRKKYKKK